MLVIDGWNVLQLRTSLSVAGVAENTWCSTLKIAFLDENLHKFKGYRAKK